MGAFRGRYTKEEKDWLKTEIVPNSNDIINSCEKYRQKFGREIEPGGLKQLVKRLQDPEKAKENWKKYAKNSKNKKGKDIVDLLEESTKNPFLVIIERAIVIIESMEKVIELVKSIPIEKHKDIKVWGLHEKQISSKIDISVV